MTAKSYSGEQLARYAARISLTSPLESAQDPVARLTELVHHQLVHVPFETLALHYSPDRLISLGTAAVFDRIVTRRRGGYCLENNTFFGHVLRSLGYSVYGVVCRITMATRGVHDGSWRLMQAAAADSPCPRSHMANVVTLNNIKYLVDVGYGADGPITPLALIPSHMVVQIGLPDQQLRLEQRTLPQHEDAGQKVSLWAKTVVVQRFERGGDGQIDKTLLLMRQVVRECDGKGKEQHVIESLQSEDERIAAFD
uniref:Arylamine N-acetyltransferase 1 n=1 Tax=Verticillium albo-atrum TaxID=27335 RepID=D8FST6_9PEZI|nr:TPA: arylamine N-acetyltransferase 1 [Verticillium albo-atrum]